MHGARRLLAAVIAIGASACAHAPPPRLSEPTIEVSLDEGRAAERPLTPARTFEMLMRLDPRLPAYRPLRLRLLLAQAGRVILTFYSSGSEGGPGAALGSIDRLYGPGLLSTGKDGKWVIEELALPVLHGPLWVGIHSPSGGGDPRLWATSTDTGAVFQRDPDPSTPLSATRIPRTPILRVEVSPASS